MGYMGMCSPKGLVLQSLAILGTNRVWFCTVVLLSLGPPHPTPTQFFSEYPPPPPRAGYKCSEILWPRHDFSETNERVGGCDCQAI